LLLSVGPPFFELDVDVPDCAAPWDPDVAAAVGVELPSGLGEIKTVLAATVVPSVVLGSSTPFATEVDGSP